MSDKERMHVAYIAMGKIEPQHESLARFVRTWRAEAKFWMDPAAPPQVSRGTMNDPTGRKTIKKRSVITCKGSEEYPVEMFFAGQAGRENKTMEIRYTRA